MAQKTNLNKSTATNFNLIFPKIPTESKVEATDQVTLNIYETVIPSLTLETSERNFMGGKDAIHSGEITFEPGFVHFIVDSEFHNGVTLYKGVTYIHNNKDRFGRDKSLYTVDATLNITDNFGNSKVLMTLRNVGPNMLGEIKLTYREGESQLESTINLMYDRYELRQV